MEALRVWVGFDSSESRAYDICVKSILSRTKAKIEIYPLRQEWLRSSGIYYAPRDPLASTEFSRTRFLTPCLAGYSGPALFMDSDFLFQADIAELFALYDPYYAIQVVQHDYRPTATTKMGGLTQTVYHRKNWSSLALFNSGHPSVKANLTPHEVNRRSGKWLHRLEWTSDTFIGALPQEWNFLVGHSQGVEPKALHFTEGLPLHGVDSEYAHLWLAEARA